MAIRLAVRWKAAPTAALAVWLVGATVAVGISGWDGSHGLHRPHLQASGLLAGVAVVGLLGPTRRWGPLAGLLGALAYGAALALWPELSASRVDLWQIGATAATLFATGLVSGAVARRVAADPAPVDRGGAPATFDRGDRRPRVVEAAELCGGIELELARARRYEHTLSLLLVGIEEWPTLVVQRGAVAATRHLSELAMAIRRVVRDVDTVSVYDGGVIAVLLPETALDGAAVVAEKIERVAVERGGLIARSGAAAYPDDALTRDELIREAEAALDLARLARVPIVSRVRLA